MNQENLNMGTNDNLDKLIDKLKRSYKPEMIMLFGSRARNDAYPDSDVDLVKKKKKKKRPIQRRIDVRKVLSTDIPMDVLVYTPDEFEALRRSGSAFYKTLVGEGKILYKRG